MPELYHLAQPLPQGAENENRRRIDSWRRNVVNAEIIVARSGRGSTG